MNRLKVAERREAEQLQPKGFRLEASKADTDAEFRQRTILLHREMRCDGNDADEMRETVAGVAFLFGAPLFIALFAPFAKKRGVEIAA